MALAALAPLLGSMFAPTALGAIGLSGLSPLLASSIGAGLGTLAATGSPLKALEGGAMGFLGGGIADKLMPASMAATGATGAIAGGDGGLTTAGMNVAQAAPKGLMAGGIQGMIHAATPGLFASSVIPPQPYSAPAGSGPVNMHAPGLKPYQIQQTVAAPQGYRPGIDPEHYYFQNDPSAQATQVPQGYAGYQGYADGGTVDQTKSGGPFQNGLIGTLMQNGGLGMLGGLLYHGGLQGMIDNGTLAGLFGAEAAKKDPAVAGTAPVQGMAAGGPINPMAATAMNMSPDQQLAAQLQQQAFATAANQMGQRPQGMAMGGRVMGISNPRDTMDQRSASMLNRSVMHQAFPYPPAMSGGGIRGGVAAVHPQMGTHVPQPLGFDMGGPVLGAGDGSSDSVPAMIDGSAPAALSTGEHIISSDAVSALGNGSSQAGHQALTQMVQRVRKKKTGKTGMPPRVNPQAMMPA